MAEMRVFLQKAGAHLYFEMGSMGHSWIRNYDDFKEGEGLLWGWETYPRIEATGADFAEAWEKFKDKLEP